MHTGTKPSNWAFHFIKGNKLRDGTTAPPDGEWLEYKGPIVICRSGLHASYRVADALTYAPGNTLCLVELDGIVDGQSDKVVASKRKIIARFDATELLRADARASALSVAHVWKMPLIVRQYLETGNEALLKDATNAFNATAASAIDHVAVYAAYAAAAYATNAANAAHAAAAYAANAANAAAADRKNAERLHDAVMAKLVEMGVLKP